MNKLTSIEELAPLRDKIQSSTDSDHLRLVVCGGTGCRAAGSVELAEVLAKLIGEQNLNAQVELMLSGCHGFCQQGPVVVIEPAGIFYREVGRKNPKRDAEEIIERTIKGGEIVTRLLYRNPKTKERIQHYKDIPFYSHQTRIVLKNNGKIDPNNIEHFIARDGYDGLAKALTMDPEEIIDHISRSGLRGRGGGGFPTGRKWSFCRNAPDKSMRYIICNADEGDPGAFMDRSIIEGDPHSVIEGMIIGAYAISGGVSPAAGYVYIRAEYPLAIENLKIALKQAEELGFLGDNILGTDFSFHIKIKQGAGAFVCGEETALIASIEGHRGMPRPRPPFPAISGLFGKPTNINNVETWASVTRIIQGGVDWYAGIGTEKSRGTKVFSLVGQTNNSGLIEVPMGMPLRTIIEEIGGGVPGEGSFKAVQTGGPSGGCIPAEKLDIPVDFEHLAEVGSMMGSGGMVVMTERSCMVDVARYFLSFTESESCGKCTPCRMGTQHLLNTLTDICEGRGKPKDIERLRNIGTTVAKGSLCGLGQTAPNPVLTTLQYFEEEYRAHIEDHNCPAGVCRNLIQLTINMDLCTGCTACSLACPVGAITGEKKNPHLIDQGLCIHCGACRTACKFHAVNVGPRCSEQELVESQ